LGEQSCNSQNLKVGKKMVSAKKNASAIVWFRQDLRVHDNPTLHAAQSDGDILPIYILDDVNAGAWKMGGASRVWLHQSLHDLNRSLGGKLRIFCGDASEILLKLVEETKAQSVHWSRCYEPWRIARDKKIKNALQALGVSANSHNGSLLWEPWTILKGDQTPYKVYTPYYKNGCLNAPEPRQPLPAIKDIRFAQSSVTGGECSLKALKLEPATDWSSGIKKVWQVGEDAAASKLENFIENGLHQYKVGRDFPASNCTSLLSPHLHFGEISPHQVWHRIKQEEAQFGSDDLIHYLREIAWREFSYYLLYHWPHIPEAPFNPKYAAFPWRHDEQALGQWQKGQTGFPIIDAGMRELWQTGYMHNRVRMIVASFLVKNQLINWREGEAWFWDCLVDADLASNSASWQWSAGCGADAAPFFRIFNPVLQSEKFDSEGVYIKQYCPELSGLTGKFLHKPWEAKPEMLEAAGIELGVDYPQPILDLKVTRQRALAANSSLKT
jgi:deoxyribodipyrimidine photo-lyase